MRLCALEMRSILCLQKHWLRSSNDQHHKKNAVTALTRKHSRAHKHPLSLSHTHTQHLRIDPATGVALAQQEPATFAGFLAAQSNSESQARHLDAHAIGADLRLIRRLIDGGDCVGSLRWSRSAGPRRLCLASYTRFFSADDGWWCASRHPASSRGSDWCVGSWRVGRLWARKGSATHTRRSRCATGTRRSCCTGCVSLVGLFGCCHVDASRAHRLSTGRLLRVWPTLRSRTGG